MKVPGIVVVKVELFNDKLTPSKKRDYAFVTVKYAFNIQLDAFNIISYLISTGKEGRQQRTKSYSFLAHMEMHGLLKTW